jgi:hypothetical protein
VARGPCDFVGAQAILLSVVVGFPVTVDDPAFEAARANAEAMIRDEPGRVKAATPRLGRNLEYRSARGRAWSSTRAGELGREAAASSV